MFPVFASLLAGHPWCDNALFLMPENNLILPDQSVIFDRNIIHTKKFFFNRPGAGVPADIFLFAI
jgi:hypothetical protein